VLGLIPWIYLALAVLFAVTHSAFIICRFDPLVGIFRLGGNMTLILFGVVLLVISIFTARPFCRFICPYGALLSLFARVSIWRMNITKQNCNNCELCHNACPVDAILPPYENKVKESRITGVKRILVYLLILPLMALLGGLTMRMLSDTLSKTHKEVRLYEMVLEHEQNPQEILSLDLEAFYALERTVEGLLGQVDHIKQQFRSYSTIAGVFLGIVFGWMLIELSIKRNRKQYEIDDAQCVNCARCFNYCPQNINTIIKDKII
jgi:ferredoxin